MTMFEQEDHPKKIALEGAACVGKSTLLAALRRSFRGQRDVAFVNEAARSYFRAHPVPETEIFSVPIQTAIQKLILKKEKGILRRSPKVIVCDRSVIDSPVHLFAEKKETDARRLMAKIADWLPTYSLFLLLDPADVPFKNDAERKESVEKRQQIHETFLQFLVAENLPYLLLSGNLEERQATVAATIQSFL